MTNWTWKTLDYSKVQVGDIIIQNILERFKNA